MKFTNLFILFITLNISFSSLAQEAIGARSNALAGASIANTHDSFALVTSPSNLLAHGDSSQSEFAISFQQTPENQSQDQDGKAGFQYVGGFTNFQQFMLGGYYVSSTTPTYLMSSDLSIPEIAYADSFAISVAYGNALTDDYGLIWGIGTSLEVSSLWRESDNEEIGVADYAHIFSGKIGYGYQFAFDTWALDSFINFAIGHQSKIEKESTQYLDILVRPKTTNFGVMTEFTYLDEDGLWQLMLVVEKTIVDVETVFIEFDTPFLKESLAIGAEFSINNFSIRTGRIEYDDIPSDTFSSVGMGYSTGLWSFDLSVNESFINNEEHQYSLSITRKLGV